jgi:hypothetical protein
MFKWTNKDTAHKAKIADIVYLALSAFSPNLFEIVLPVFLTEKYSPTSTIPAIPIRVAPCSNKALLKDDTIKAPKEAIRAIVEL